MVWTLPKDDKPPSMGHSFTSWNLICKCSRSWDQHQEHPTVCPNYAQAIADWVRQVCEKGRTTYLSTSKFRRRPYGPERQLPPNKGTSK